MQTQRVAHSQNPLWGVLIMIVASIFIGYYLTMTVLLRENKTDSLNKLYQGVLMGLWMGIVEILMVGFLMQTWYSFYNIVLTALVMGVFLFTYLIYYQVGVTPDQYMLRMIEHHQAAIDATQQVQPKTTDPELLSLMDQIVTSQKAEIEQMRDLLEKR